MNKLKNWTIIVLTFFVLSLAGAYKILGWSFKQVKADRDRLALNQERLLEQNSSQNIELTLTKKEFTNQVRENDSLKQVLNALDIKPKYIIKYIDRTFTDKITATKFVPLSLVSKNTWSLKDETPCMKYRATIFLTGDSLSFRRDLFSYDNHSWEFLSREKKGKFLFWDTYYKKRYVLTDSSKCGDSRSRTINVLK